MRMNHILALAVVAMLSASVNTVSADTRSGGRANGQVQHTSNSNSSSNRGGGTTVQRQSNNNNNNKAAAAPASSQRPGSNASAQSQRSMQSAQPQNNNNNVKPNDNNRPNNQPDQRVQPNNNNRPNNQPDQKVQPNNNNRPNNQPDHKVQPNDKPNNQPAPKVQANNRPGSQAAPHDQKFQPKPKAPSHPTYRRHMSQKACQFRIDDITYYYLQGTYYRYVSGYGYEPIEMPENVYVDRLPYGSRQEMRGGAVYYYYYGIWFAPLVEGGYMIVPEPAYSNAPGQHYRPTISFRAIFDF